MYYNLSKLKLNKEKTALLISSKPKHRDTYKNIKVETNDDETDVKQQNQVKILGFITNKRGNNDCQISKIVSEISNMFNVANKNRKYMNEKTRRAFVNSHIMGRLNYNMPIIAAGTNCQRARIVKLMHQAARFIRNDYCFRESIHSIMRSIEWKMPVEIIEEASAKYMQKVIYNKKPIDIYNEIKMPRTRACVKPIMERPPKSSRMENSIINTALHNNNRLPPDLKDLKPKKLKKELLKTKLLPHK